MKKAIIALAAAGVLLLSGCAGQDENVSAPNGTEDTTVHRAFEFDYKLEDGRVLHCVWFGAGYGQASTGGPSCDWDGAK